MTEKQNTEITASWIEGNLRLASVFDNRVIALLKAIQQNGSLNQAAKQVGLSYKGAWQIVERTNNSSPKTLVATATGGFKGGGTFLTEAGQALITLFDDLEEQHQLFLKQLNRKIAENLDNVLLLQRLIVKTSARNQLFGCVVDIQIGVINVQVIVQLKGNEQITTTISKSAFDELGLKIDSDAVLLINSSDITLVSSEKTHQFSARNCLLGNVLMIQKDAVNLDVIVLLAGGETLVATTTQSSLLNLNLEIGTQVQIIFKTNAPILGVKF